MQWITEIKDKYGKIPDLMNLTHIPAFEKFSQIDTNADGLLDITEATRFLVPQQIQHADHLYSSAYMDDHFKAMDKNTDGFIQPGELDADLKF